jgi:hypothetical protein
MAKLFSRIKNQKSQSKKKKLKGLNGARETNAVKKKRKYADANQNTMQRWYVKFRVV